MKVCILTEGGRNTGLGHITRCTSIYQAFEDIAIKPELIVKGDETVHDFVKDKNCKIFDWLNDRETLFALVGDADIVFIDSYLADYDLYKKISDIAGISVHFDDNVRINYPKGFVVNGAVFAEQMPYPKRKGVTYLLGAQYAPLRKEFWDVPEKSICEDLKTIMITFGGADIRNLTPKVLKLLIDAHPELRKKVIIGKGFQNTAQIEDVKDHNTELIYYPSSAEMKKLMLESDIAVAGGGQTLYELARVGVPTITVAVAGNQLDILLGWKKAGLIEYAGRWTDSDWTEKTKKYVEELTSHNLRLEKSSELRKLFDGKSTLHLVGRLIEYHKDIENETK